MAYSQLILVIQSLLVVLALKSDWVQSNDNFSFGSRFEISLKTKKQNNHYQESSDTIFNGLTGRENNINNLAELFIYYTLLVLFIRFVLLCLALMEKLIQLITIKINNHRINYSHEVAMNHPDIYKMLCLPSKSKNLLS